MPPADAVYTALHYAARFQYAPSLSEVCFLVYGYQSGHVPIDSRYVEHAGRYSLTQQTAFIEQSQQRSIIAQQKVARLQTLRWLCAWMPWIKAVLITGSVAANNAREEDDLDLLIITAPQRLWLTRLLLVPLLDILHLRRRKDDQATDVRNKICLNMWIAGNALIEPYTDLYAANELIRAKPLINRQQTYERYIVANMPWLREHLPLWQAPEVTTSAPGQAGWKALNCLDVLARRYQMARMASPTNELVAIDRLHFHAHDYRADWSMPKKIDTRSDSHRDY